MSSSQPIGIFDSGVGGTSIWKEINQLLPNENTIYLADSKNAPYGVKSAQQIVELSRKNTNRLLEMDCKIIVVACNTATTNAIKELRSSYSLPFIGIEPAIKPAAIQSKTKAVGILATKGTLASELFLKSSELYARDINVIEVEGQGLVELIEAGKKDSPETEKLLLELLQPMLISSIDYLVLGCSHYPYLVPVLQKILPENVQIIDSGEAVARQTKAVLQAHGILNSETEIPAGKKQFFTNVAPQVLHGLINAEDYGYQVSFLDF